MKSHKDLVQYFSSYKRSQRPETVMLTKTKPYPRKNKTLCEVIVHQNMKTLQKIKKILVSENKAKHRQNDLRNK